jgi:hypothetical protein
MESKNNLPRRIVVALPLVFLLASAVTSSFWRSTWSVLSLDMRFYSGLRDVYGYQGIPIEHVVERLNGWLPLSQPVALGDAIAANPVLSPRFTESLYPRPLERQSPYRVDLGPPSNFSGPEDRILVRYRSGSSLKVVVLVAPAATLPAGNRGPVLLDFSWKQLLGVCAAVLGLGLATCVLLPKSIRPGGWIALPFAVLLWAFVFAVLATAGTILQLQLPWLSLAVGGPFLLAGISVFALRRRTELAQLLRSPGSRWLAPENALIVALLALFAADVAHFPIIGWDGRLLWLFKTKQFFTRGIIARQDVASPWLAFSHFEYPLLFPACASFFSSLSRGYNERMASMAFPFLLAAEVGATWILSRRLLGRWSGASFTLIAFFTVEGSIAAGYIDGLLCLLIVLEFLAFALPELSSVAWIAAADASLLKREGLILAASMAVIAVLLLPETRRKSVRSRVLPFLLFAPAVMFSAWTKSLGVKPDPAYSDIHWNEVILFFPQRARVVLGGAWQIVSNGLINSVTHGRFAALGLCGLLIAAVTFGLRRRRSSPMSVAAFLAAAAFLAFVFGTLVITPLDIRWHVGTAIGRLLLLPSTFCILAAFLFLEDAPARAD